MAESFTHAISLSDDHINLAEAALLIADIRYPGLQAGRYLRRLDELAAAIAPALRASRRVDTTAERRAVLTLLNEYLFGEQGFTGNRENYYDPRNSYLHEVLDRRTGIPITLSVVYLEVGWRLGLPLAGVGLPAHFMVRWVGAGEPLLIDPFGQGELMDLAGCQNRLGAMIGRPVILSPDWLRPVSRRYILSRILMNLRAAAAQAGSFDEAIGAAEKLLILRPNEPEEVRDLGLLHTQAGHRWAAIRHLGEYLSLRPEAQDAEQVKQLTNTLFDEVAGEA